MKVVSFYIELVICNLGIATDNLLVITCYSGTLCSIWKGSKVDAEHADVTSNDVLLYEGATLTLSANNIMIMQFKMCHNLTDQSLTDLLNLLKVHCPKPNHIPNTMYQFKKFFKDSMYQIKAIESFVCT